jgi:L-ascorbate metabolism protein UlaG (beta-lactamase superfamily)
MRNWTNRTGDRDKIFWRGYVLESHAGRRILFPGDMAWFDDLSTIGDDYDPFDVAAIPIGASTNQEGLWSLVISMWKKPSK